PVHLTFLQSDIQDFEKYRTTLGALTKKGDTKPAHEIFARFLQRAEERNSLSTNLLAKGNFDFTGHERFLASRKNAPQPKDMDEAKKVWEEEVRYEFLQEKLSAPDIKLSGDLKSEPTKFVITLTTNKMHPQNFDLLPKNFYDAHGKPVAFLHLEANKTNATVEIPKLKGDNLQNFKRPFFSEDGKEVGSITSTNKSTNFVGTVQLNRKNYSELTQTLQKRYDRLMKSYRDLDPDSVLELYLGALARAYDPHSEYMGHAQTENFNISMKLSLFGIGAVLQSEDGFCKIKELVPGPAMKSKKIKPGDKIVAVAQGDKEPLDVIGMRLDKVVEHIRGPKGSEVRLTIVPADAADSSTREVVTLYRDQIKLEDQEAKARVYDTQAANGNAVRIGVIDLPSFYADTTGQKRLASSDATSTATSTTLDCARLIRRMKKEGVTGIILDLRKNGGGYLEEAIGLTGLFITKGPVVQTKEFNGEIVTESDPDPGVLWDGPLVVLTSKFSASASEILAGALQDYNRALIVGEKSTFGKGTVQTLASVANYIDSSRLPKNYDPGTLRLTIRKFYRAGGASTQLKGVVSDIALPSVHDEWEVGEGSMENALPWDEVPTADPENLRLVAPYVTALREHSQKRVNSEKDFQYERDRIAEYKKAQADKTVSLNEAERLAEKKLQQAKEDARTKEISSRKKPTEKVYEITQENVNVSTLQPPKSKNADTAKASENPGPSSASTVAASEEDAPDVGEEAVANEARLREAKNILIDYISMLNKSGSIAHGNATTAK
ncbi:MAG: carboxyl-terminal protease, partial [Verrucomicrobiales bacterium]|nr:carboxyl-terminal protease [Verrucomicrobiales bacterium]